MNIKLTPYPVAKAPKNKWVLEVQFMSGDADAYETEKYTFKTQEEFEKVYQFFDKCIEFKDKYHNLMIDLWDREGSKNSHIPKCEEAEAKYKSYGYTGQELQDQVDATKQCKLAIEEFFGQYDSIDGMLKELKIDIPRDVTSDGQFKASIDSIEDMYYYDENGVKFKIKVD